MQAYCALAEIGYNNIVEEKNNLELALKEGLKRFPDSGILKQWVEKKMNLFNEKWEDVVEESDSATETDEDTETDRSEDGRDGNEKINNVVGTKPPVVGTSSGVVGSSSGVQGTDERVVGTKSGVPETGTGEQGTVRDVVGTASGVPVQTSGGVPIQTSSGAGGKGNPFSGTFTVRVYKELRNVGKSVTKDVSGVETTPIGGIHEDDVDTTNMTNTQFFEHPVTAEKVNTMVDESAAASEKAKEIIKATIEKSGTERKNLEEDFKKAVVEDVKDVREKRKIKVSNPLKSPFVTRIVPVNEKPSKEELDLCNAVFASKRDNRPV